MKKYTRKQIVEALAYWKKQLKKMNEESLYGTPDGNFEARMKELYDQRGDVACEACALEWDVRDGKIDPDSAEYKSKAAAISAKTAAVAAELGAMASTAPMSEFEKKLLRASDARIAACRAAASASHAAAEAAKAQAVTYA